MLQRYMQKYFEIAVRKMLPILLHEATIMRASITHLLEEDPPQLLSHCMAFAQVKSNLCSRGEPNMGSGTDRRRVT